MYKQHVIIHGLPKMTNSSARNNWRAVAAERKKWKKLIWFNFLGKLPPTPLLKASVEFIRHSSVEPDFDGLVSGFKGVCDGLKEAKIIHDDKMSVIGQPKYTWVKAKPKAGKIEIIVTEINT